MTILDLRIATLKLRNRLFGPPYTAEDMTLLRTRADVEGWTDILERLQLIRSRRRRRLWIHYLSSGVITVQSDDPYQDDDPFQQEL
jgi:hypothetical protein